MPQPIAAITRDRTGILYAGTSVTFTCNVTLDSSVDALESVSIQWTGPRAIPGQQYSVTDATGSGLTYSGSLSIIPLEDDRDDGTYMCNVTVTGGSFILAATNSDETTLDVTSKKLLYTSSCVMYMHGFDNSFASVSDLPTLVVTIASTSLPLTSQSFTFECMAVVVDGLLEQPSLELVAPNGTSLVLEANSTSLQYTLSSLETSDGGEYTCIIILTIPGSGIDRQGSATETITVVGMLSFHDH